MELPFLLILIALIVLLIYNFSIIIRNYQSSIKAGSQLNKIGRISLIMIVISFIYTNFAFIFDILTTFDTVNPQPGDGITNGHRTGWMNVFIIIMAGPSGNMDTLIYFAFLMLLLVSIVTLTTAFMVFLSKLGKNQILKITSIETFRILMLIASAHLINDQITVEIINNTRNRTHIEINELIIPIYVLGVILLILSGIQIYQSRSKKNKPNLSTSGSLYPVD